MTKVCESKKTIMIMKKYTNIKNHANFILKKNTIQKFYANDNKYTNTLRKCTDVLR